MSGGLKGEALSYLTYHLTNGELGRDWGPEAFLPALKLANANGLLYPFLKVVSDRIPLADPIRKLFKEEESKAEEVRRTVAFLMELLEGSGVDYLFIKLYRGFDYLPRDVDLLLKEEELALVMKLLRERGFKPLGFRKVEAKYFKPGLVRVDLYTDMRYLGLEFLSKEFLWEGTRYEEFLGLTIPIPNPVADLLINSLHVLLGHRYLSLLDFLYLDRLTRMGGRNVRVAFKYALKYGWGGSFLYLLKLLREVREAIQEGREVRLSLIHI